MIKISIVTPSYNQASFLETTINSIVAQQGPFELEYIVVDGGSNDGSQDILRRHENRLSWTSGPDEGQIDAINRGLKQASGDVVGWVNSDDYLFPGALAHVSKTFASEPDCRWLHGGCVVVDRQGNEIRRAITRYKRYHSRRYSFRRLLVRNFISQMTVFWRRELIDSIGYLDPEYPLAFDYEYWLRLAKIAAPVYVDQDLAAFRWYPTSKSGSQFKRQFDENLRIADAYGADRWSVSIAKRLNHWMTLTAYRGLSLIGAKDPANAAGTDD